jgi:siroheme synthase (precorrin-2 oxidase/ferrochelatase)
METAISDKDELTFMVSAKVKEQIEAVAAQEIEEAVTLIEQLSKKYGCIVFLRNDDEVVYVKDVLDDLSSEMLSSIKNNIENKLRRSIKERLTDEFVAKIKEETLAKFLEESCSLHSEANQL